jgi:hypothetical protein
MLRGRDGVFNPDQWNRGFSHETIVDHLRECLEIVDELDPPASLAVAVFGVVQQMVSSIEPTDAALRAAMIANGALPATVGGLRRAP